MPDLLKNKKTRHYIYEAVFLLGIFLFCAHWARLLPLDAGPDEQMRYSIPLYIYEHGALPHGGDPEIRNSIWGTSYAFLPILSYILSAGSMKIMSLFSTAPQNLLWAARLISCLFTTGTSFFAFRIGKKVFSPRSKWLFVCMTAVLPEAIFMGVYVNNDAMGICCGAAIVYFWILGIERKWDIFSCIGLGIWLGLCALSYMNAYGFLLCSVFVYTFTTIPAKEEYGGWRFWLKHGILIAFTAFLVCGWWFIRNYILYDGDFLGLATSNHYADLYALEQFKPSLALSSARMQGYSIFQMLTGSWMADTCRSFIGVFGQSQYWMESWVCILYYFLFAAGSIGCLLRIKKLLSQKGNDDSFQSPVFHWGMLFAAVIPFMLNIYHSYCVDYQAQGRYNLPSLIPLMYFMVLGIDNLFASVFLRCAKKPRTDTDHCLQRDQKIMDFIFALFCVILTLITIWEFFYIY